MNNQPDIGKFTKTREWMLQHDLRGRDIKDPNVLRVMKEVLREEFVQEAYYSEAYADNPLPIGLGQTISQPYIVALMTQELKLDKDCEVLEIGTGSGYQTAVLCKLASRVYTIEKYAELSEFAQSNLSRVGIGNVEFYVGDGSCGWPEPRTFERIILTAAVPDIPQPLFEQLANGGIMIAPVGGVAVQELVLCRKESGKLTKRAFCDVRFVKLTGKYGFEE